HLELGDLGPRQLAALLEHVELAAGDGDRPLLRLGAPEHVPGAIERAARLVAARARVVEELPRAGARGDQRLLALEAALGEVQHRCRLPELGLPRAHVLLPGALAELDRCCWRRMSASATSSSSCLATRRVWMSVG